MGPEAAKGWRSAMPRTRPEYPEEFRREAVQMVRSGGSVWDVAGVASDRRLLWRGAATAEQQVLRHRDKDRRDIPGQGSASHKGVTAQLSPLCAASTSTSSWPSSSRSTCSSSRRCSSRSSRARTHAVVQHLERQLPLAHGDAGGRPRVERLPAEALTTATPGTGSPETPLRNTRYRARRPLLGYRTSVAQE